MRILVSCVPYDSGKSGISVYVREVVKSLAAQGNELTLICEPGVDGILPADVPHSVMHAPRWTSSAVLSMVWHLLILPFFIQRHRRDFDGFVICAANRRVCAWYPICTTATVHDLANFHIPGKYSRMRMFYLARVLPFFAKRAQKLVAVSGATKADMVRFWKCHDEDVAVLYNGLGDSVKPFTKEAGAKGVGSAILYISRIEHPGKNHVRLIEAYGRLPRSLAAEHPLLIAGADWKDADIVHEAAVKSPHADLIRFTGFVEQSSIEDLWAKTGFYVFPSLFEGFGLSLVEAMERRIPCACSNNGSLGEIAADVAMTFDPESVDSIAATLESLLTEPESERAARVRRGVEHVKRFSWDDHAKGLVRLIEGNSLTPMASASLFGIPVAKVTEAEAVERIVTMAKNPLKGRAQFIATLNVDFVANAVKCCPFDGNEELWGYLKRADFVTADGMPIVLLSRLMRQPLPERVTGADLVPAICRRFAEVGLSVYVLGGEQAALDEAFSRLGIQNLKVVGLDPAFVKLDEPQPEIVERINTARPDLLFVALGNPKQELWMGRNASKLKIPAMIGIGGTFNFLAGRVKRAPRWVQRCGAEWIYRVLQEPGRLWKRYAYGLVKFSYLAVRQLAGGWRQ